MDSPTPTTRAELLQRVQEKRVDFDNLLATVPDITVEEPNLPNGWSVKDLLAHVAAYERWMAGHIGAVTEGRVPTNEDLYEGGAVLDSGDPFDLDTLNASIYEHFHDMPWPTVRAFAGESYTALIDAISAVPEDDFNREGLHGWLDNGTLLSRLPELTYGHYTEHDADLRTVAGRMA
ncbi:MAG: ClbS/DfsB family four-helix bundle protein [Thermomicrobiales bacterium]|nr:ClbS/DfsB family four-helix bundle protein [Thermomicrobiales bacterium]